MKHRISLLLAVTATAFLLGSCANEPEKKPVGPTTETSRMPWNTPVPGQGQGQFGMMPQNQYRR
jgi:PBP1b-binding outer membrane lipoprotein LpoB